jgi:hypothetical protein
VFRKIVPQTEGHGIVSHMNNSEKGRRKALSYRPKRNPCDNNNLCDEIGNQDEKGKNQGKHFFFKRAVHVVSSRYLKVR